MTRPSDLNSPNKYEILKLDTGQEVVGMTKQFSDFVEITCPMVCHLSVTQRGKTLATFYPYSPLTSDTVVTIPEEMILHRNTLNTQVVPLYDDASVQWLTMIENGSIPLVNKLIKDDSVSVRNETDKRIKSLYDLEHLSRLEEEFLDELEAEFLNETDSSFESAIPPKDKKKIH